MPKRYGQPCPVAKTLELIGDRWTLLLVRDLLPGTRRFQDLLDVAPRHRAQYPLRPAQADGGARPGEPAPVLRPPAARGVRAHGAGQGAGRGRRRARRLGLAPRLQARGPRPHGLRASREARLLLPGLRPARARRRRPPRALAARRAAGRRPSSGPEPARPGASLDGHTPDALLPASRSPRPRPRRPRSAPTRRSISPTRSCNVARGPPGRAQAGDRPLLRVARRGLKTRTPTSRMAPARVVIPEIRPAKSGRVRAASPPPGVNDHDRERAMTGARAHAATSPLTRAGATPRAAGKRGLHMPENVSVASEARREESPAAVWRRPVSTYRLQLGADFTFRDAQDILPYLAELGVTDCYLSPFFQPCGEASHGYDVADHGRINEALGGEPAYQAFCEAAGRQGLGQVLDVVPNHMGITGGRNQWWLDVLENGPASPLRAVLRYRLGSPPARAQAPGAPADPRRPVRSRSGKAGASARVPGRRVPGPVLRRAPARSDPAPMRRSFGCASSGSRLSSARTTRTSRSSRASSPPRPTCQAGPTSTPSIGPSEAARRGSSSVALTPSPVSREPSGPSSRRTSGCSTGSRDSPRASIASMPCSPSSPIGSPTGVSRPTRSTIVGSSTSTGSPRSGWKSPGYSRPPTS